MKWIRYAAAVALLALLSGCGGGSHNGTAAGSRGGRLTLKVVWPAPSKLIPAASNSIKAVLTSGSTMLGSQTLARPATGNTASVTFTDLQPSSVTLTATAFPNADGTGVAQATGSAPAIIVAGQTAQVTITLNSTIATLTITPANPSVIVGQTTPLTATAFDSAGNVVLVAPGSLQWSSAATATATVDASGIITGVAAGTAAVTVKEAESGVTSAPVTVTVHDNTVSVNDPRYMAMSPDGQTLYAVSVGSSSVAQLHINADGTLTPISPATGGSLPGGGLPLDIQTDPQSTAPFVYVSTPDLDVISQFRRDGSGALSPLAQSFASTNFQDQPAGIAIHPNGRFLYTADPVHSSPTVSPRISMFSINADGTLSPLAPDLSVSGFVVNRLVVAPNGQFLFTNNSTGPTRGQVLRSFRINADGTLSLVGEFGGQSINVFALTVDPTSRFVYTANNVSSGGSISSFQIGADGSLTEVGTAAPSGTQTANALAVTPNGKFLYAPGSNDDRVFQYAVNADGSLTPLSPASVPTGHVPLDVEITPNGQFLYISNSRSNTVSEFRINADGTLAPL